MSFTVLDWRGLTVEQRGLRLSSLESSLSQVARGLGQGWAEVVSERDGYPPGEVWLFIDAAPSSQSALYALGRRLADAMERTPCWPLADPVSGDPYPQVELKGAVSYAASYFTPPVPVRWTVAQKVELRAAFELVADELRGGDVLPSIRYLESSWRDLVEDWRPRGPVWDLSLARLNSTAAGFIAPGRWGGRAFVPQAKLYAARGDEESMSERATIPIAQGERPVLAPNPWTFAFL